MIPHTYIDINAASIHTPDYYYEDHVRKTFNAHNPGLGITLNDKFWQIKAGEYFNSFKKQTVYIGVGPRIPFAVGPVNLSIGTLAGLATGYDHTILHMMRYQPIGLIDGTIRYKKARLFIGYEPPVGGVSVIMFQIEWRISK